MCICKQYDRSMIVGSFEILLPACVMRMTEQMCTVVPFIFGCGWTWEAGLDG